MPSKNDGFFCEISLQQFYADKKKVVFLQPK